MKIDFSRHKLGLSGSLLAPRNTPLLSKYIADAGRLLESTQIPAASDWSDMPTRRGTKPIADTDPLGNIEAGDCFFALIAHQVRMIGQHINNPSLCPSTADVVAEYSRRTGYDPSTGANDVGFNMFEGLDIWMREGFFGTKALAYALVDNTQEAKIVANWLGCGTCGGFALPKTAQRQTDVAGRQLWSVTSSPGPDDVPGSWGNHAIYCYSPSPGLEEGTSWGERVAWTPAWGSKYNLQRILVLVDAWVRNNRAPNGFALNDLLSDMRARNA